MTTIPAVRNDMPVMADGQRMNPDGERALRLALTAIEKSTPVDHKKRGETLVELGAVAPRRPPAIAAMEQLFASAGEVIPNRIPVARAVDLLCREYAEAHPQPSSQPRPEARP